MKDLEIILNDAVALTRTTAGHTNVKDAGMIISSLILAGAILEAAEIIAKEKKNA